MINKNKKTNMTCPSCKEDFVCEDSKEKKTFPFCSKRCKMIDLGRWLENGYTIECTENSDSC